MMKKFSMMALFALLVMAMVGCGKSGKKAETLLEKIKTKGEIVVYTNPRFPPYEYLGANGEIVGAEIELVHKIAERLGVKANVVSAEFDSILVSVTTGKADMGASGFTINEERKKKVDFSIPFVSSVQYLIVPEASEIKVVEDLKGKTVGVQSATTGALMVEDAVNKGVLQNAGTELKIYNAAPDAMVAMKEGKVEAMVIDELVAKSLSAKNPGTKCFQMLKADGNGLESPEEFGIMLAKGNEDVMAVVNEVIAEMLADGSLEAITLKHMDISKTE